MVFLFLLDDGIYEGYDWGLLVGGGTDDGKGFNFIWLNIVSLGKEPKAPIQKEELSKPKINLILNSSCSKIIHLIPLDKT